MYKKILVATDGSDLAKDVIECAAASAEKWEAHLLILTVVPPSPSISFTDVCECTYNCDTEYDEVIMSYHLAVLDDAKRSLKEKHPKLSVSTQIKKGDAAAQILAVSEEAEVDLIVIGNRGQSGLTGWFLGGVTNYVVSHCKKPILIVK